MWDQVTEPIDVSLHALLAVLQRRWLGFAILTTNVLTSTIAHRLHREPAVDAADRVDEMAILLWVAYNTWVVLQLARVELAMWRTGLIALAVLGAAGSGLLDARRRALPWRSPRRTVLHVAMHLSGAVGTFLLLSAAM